MFLYFRSRIDKRLESERLLESLRSEARRMVRDMIQELNRVTDRNVTLVVNKAEELGKILDQADKRILLARRDLKNGETLDEKMYAKGKEKPPAKTQPPAETTEPESPVVEKDQMILEIVDLYHKGISADLIANKLDLPVGEVELLIALQDRKGRN
jgi:hypothetical protein